MGQITLRIGEKFGWCPSICRKTKFSERRNRLHHFRTQSFKTIERQRTAKLVRQSAEDGPVLASVARREYGLVATLHPAFQVHISPGLLGLGAPRRDSSTGWAPFFPWFPENHFKPPFKDGITNISGPRPKKRLCFGAAITFETGEHTFG